MNRTDLSMKNRKIYIKIKDFDKWSQMKTDEDLNEVTKDIVNDVVEEKKLDIKN